MDNKVTLSSINKQISAGKFAYLGCIRIKAVRVNRKSSRTTYRYEAQSERSWAWDRFNDLSDIKVSDKHPIPVNGDMEVCSECRIPWNSGYDKCQECHCAEHEQGSIEDFSDEALMKH